MGIGSVEALRFLLSLSVLLFASRLLGSLCVKLRSPRVIGEIGAGILLGPTFAQWAMPELHAYLFTDIPIMPQLLGVPFWLGLGFLMFASGYELNLELAGRDSRLIFVLIAATTLIPFVVGVGLSHSDVFGWRVFWGDAADGVRFGIVMGVALAITSVPVISRIFMDLGILGTRYAGVVLSVASVHDVILWLVLAVALPSSAGDGLGRVIQGTCVATIVFATIVFVVPRILARYEQGMESWFNQRTNAGPLVVLWGLSSALGLIGTEFIFGAMAAGLLTRTISRVSRNRAFGEQIKGFALSSFIPVYFALVGFRLDLIHNVPLAAMVVLFVLATVVQTTLVWVSAKSCGYASLQAVNLAAALNAKGGPGIVLASVAFEQKIINVQMFSMLVLLAVLTSWAAGAWIQFCQARGWTLLSEAD